MIALCPVNIIRRNKALVHELSEPAPETSDLYFPTQYSQSTLGQFRTCLWKQWWTYWRSPDYNLVRFFLTLVTALLLGTIFWRVGLKRGSANNLRIVIGSMYGAVMFIGVNNCSTVQPLVAIERTVFYRESAAGMYSALPYAMAQFYFISFFSFLYFTYYGMMTVSLSPNHQVAAIFATTFYSVFNLFSGFFIPGPLQLHVKYTLVEVTGAKICIIIMKWRITG
ncbi:hypothetical protein Cni_G07162 [Canna indica]|uniref:ABC-2 type transporter transmembrane domain-containing protein n=1 Tax=Canna indica TaxID=4628 RepID=A0AAQ3K366_9LILI|nr:hypothetical protein Cni_G07162 [Canna indica]